MRFNVSYTDKAHKNTVDTLNNGIECIKFLKRESKSVTVARDENIADEYKEEIEFAEMNQNASELCATFPLKMCTVCNVLYYNFEEFIYNV